MTQTDSVNWLSLAAILAVIGAIALALGSQELRTVPRQAHEIARPAMMKPVTP